MESFVSWQARVAEAGEGSASADVLFLAYNSTAGSQASAAGFELVGTSWDAHGAPVNVYKPRPPGAPVYGCTVCGGNSKLYQGMYCCGKKRIPSK